MSEDILERAKALTSPWRFGSDYGIWDLLPELIAEIESNRALIDQTAENFLKLEPGIAWEGGIDAAMKATVEEVERLRSENNRINKLREAEINQAGAAERVYLEAMVAKDARIDLLDSDQKRYHAAWMAAEEGKEEQAARIKELEALNESLMENGNDLGTRCQKAEARIKELQDLIDKPPEEADWVADYHLSTCQNASGNA